MANKIYKAAVIGCGNIGAEIGNYRKEIQPATHAGAYCSNPRTKLSALVDVDEKRLKKIGTYFPGIPLYRSAEEMFKNIKPDIVSVATNPDSHAPLVKLAAKNKVKAILCEKPISNSVKQAEEMLKICRKSNSLLFINHQRRFDPLLTKWRDRIKNGLLGEIIQCNCYYYNGLFNNGTHIMDLFRFFLGDVDWVMALTNEKTSWKEADKDVDALICFKSGARLTIQALPKNYGLVEFSFYGTKGSLIIRKLGYEVEYRELIENKYFKNYYQLSDRIKKEGQARSFIKSVVSQIVSCLDGKATPLSTGEDGLAALKILLALRESAAKGGKIVKIK